MRVKLVLAYNGTAFEGSQEQAHTPNTVTGTMQRALARLSIHTKPVASGRTDAGVHATGQVMHCDLPDYWADLEKLRRSLNHQLPSSIHIRHIEPAAPDFHARFSARRRIYRYVLQVGESNPFEDPFVTFVDALDFGRIRDAVRLFEGTHDFSNFRKTGSDVKHEIRTIYRARAYRYRGKTVLYFEGNGFLRSQIRLMVGFLLKVSAGELGETELSEQLSLQKRHTMAIAPSNGLYLAKIIY